MHTGSAVVFQESGQVDTAAVVIDVYPNPNPNLQASRPA